MHIYCATSNPGKLREFQEASTLYAGQDVNILALPGMNAIPICEETGKTIEENAVLKARHYGSHTNGFLFGEDSGLEVAALNGEPGVFSARWGGAEVDDEANNRLLLKCLRGVQDRMARFVCVIALVRDGQLLRTFHGEAQGHILQEPQGTNGFGYDPLFFYPPLKCSFAELNHEEKLQVSHRGRAIEAMVHYLRDLVVQGSGDQ